MAERLTTEQVPAWSRRFSAFGDAVIRRVTVQEAAAGTGREAVVLLDAQDGEADGEWVRVELTVQDVGDFRIVQGPEDFMVIFELRLDCGADAVEISQDDRAWFIRGSRLSWSVEPLDKPGRSLG